MAIERAKRADDVDAERLLRAVRNVIAGNPLLSQELAKARMLREMLPRRLAGKVAPEIIRLIEVELDEIIATATAAVEQIARSQQK